MIVANKIHHHHTKKYPTVVGNKNLKSILENTRENLSILSKVAQQDSITKSNTSKLVIGQLKNKITNISKLSITD